MTTNQPGKPQGKPEKNVRFQPNYGGLSSAGSPSEFKLAAASTTGVAVQSTTRDR
jgi:hypothetical protein